MPRRNSKEDPTNQDPNDPNNPDYRPKRTGVNNPKKEDDSSCFPTNTTITGSSDKTYIEDLVEGDQVLAWNDEGDVEFSEVWVKTHQVFDIEETYYQIDTETKRLLISPRHFVLVRQDGKNYFKKAEDVKVGDIFNVLSVENGEKKIVEEPVVVIETVEASGIHNVFTKSGRIIANGIFCSTYADVHPNLAHPLLAPLRAAYDIAPASVMGTILTSDEEGTPYLFKYAGEALKPILQ